MSSLLQAYCCNRIFDGTKFHVGAALLIENGRIRDILPANAVPAGFEIVRFDGGLLCPGYVDLQVNGGGGVMFNDAPDLKSLEMIAKAHAAIGSTSILPTLITDTPGHTRRAIEAVAEALEKHLPGIAGLHLEGPHLAISRKGAHDPSLIRPMEDSDIKLLLEAKSKIPVLKMTLAPESVTNDQIGILADAGILISLGHTDAGYETCKAAVEAGARCVTHLFNAQSQLGNREPGVVGAALDFGNLSAGLIADKVHVHPATMASALQAKKGPGAVFLVSDAMATAGSDIDHFSLNGRLVQRRGDRLTLKDGTLAGAHLDLTTAIRNLVETCGTNLETALAMATSLPANLIGMADQIGTFKPGAQASLLHLSDDLGLHQVFTV